jgi:protein O-GlcNAc transferase
MSSSQSKTKRDGLAAKPGPNLPDCDVASLFRQAVGFHQSGRLTEAEPLYRRVLDLEPQHFDSLNLLGVLNYQFGRYSDAVSHLDRAIRVNPRVAAAHNTRGAALAELGRFDEALASYSRAIALDPRYADAFYNRGNALKAVKRYDEAIADYDRATTLKPDHAASFNNRGAALKALKRFVDAVASYDSALAIRPDFADAWHNRAGALFELKEFEAALASADRAIALKPSFPEAFDCRGNILKRLERLEDAIASYDQALALRSSYAGALVNRGTALLHLDRHDEALASFEQALALPGASELKFFVGTYLHIKMHLGIWAQFAEQYALVKDAMARGFAAVDPFPLLAFPSSGQEQRQCAAIYAAEMMNLSTPALWRGEPYRHRRIRIAYTSSDFRNHPVMTLTAGLFELHDRTQFETTAIAYKFDSERPIRERLQTAFDRFVDARTLSEKEIAALLREHETDIVVDLNGFTKHARPNVFAHRPAPVQVNYLGFAGTMGSKHWDYIVADRFVIPETACGDFAENVVYLPNCFMVTDGRSPSTTAMPTRAELGLPEHGLVFCCLNNGFKITPDVFEVWLRLLRAIDGSVLWLSPNNKTAVGNLRREAEARGVAGSRLVFPGRVDDRGEYLARLSLADLFLDTLNYNAHATASDALRMGLPVLTCAGSTFASRVAGSLLSTVRLPELVTHSLADYEALALALGRDPTRLAATRAKLADNLRTAPLFDTARFTRYLEAAYVAMWERAERGEQPQSFAIAPERSDGS